MSILKGASHVAIHGGMQVAAAAGSTVNISQSSQAFARDTFKDLSTAVAHTALHNSAAQFDAPRCHRNTRAKYLNKLELWMLGQGEEFQGKRLIWLNGGAGAGKSAIMQSIIDRCTQHSVILGSFFFSRTDPSRNQAEVLIPTLAYQVVVAFPEAMIVLEPIIQHNPLIFKASLQIQAYELLVRPLLHLVKSGIMANTRPPRNLVFVIDGLDECIDSQKQAFIIHIITSILCDYNLPICFLIASRPEISISSAFQREKRAYGIFSTITLDSDNDAESDIRQFIEDSFLDILDSHPMRHHITLPWPDSRSVGNIVLASSGHFVYAATAMKFISLSHEHPVRALKVVEGLEPHRTRSPFAPLDALYLHILRSSRFTNRVLDVMRHCLFTDFPPSIMAVSCVYDFSPQDVELFLGDVQSIVSISPDSRGGLMINPKHASLGDFLSDRNRSQELYISRTEYRASFLARYFELLDNGPQAPTSWLFPSSGWDNSFIQALAWAIEYTTDSNLLQSLVCRHSPQDIWNFYRKFSASHMQSIFAVCRYICAIRDSIANKDNSLYINQFRMYIQLLSDILEKIVRREPQYRVLLAITFSSSLMDLPLAYRLLYHLHRAFRINRGYLYHFYFLEGGIGSRHIIHPQSFEAIQCLPQSRLPWSSDLALAMKLVLQQLVNVTWAPEPYAHPHRRWLKRNKPWKHISLASPRLSSSFYSYLSTIPPHREYTRGPFGEYPHKIRKQRERCLILLQYVTMYLHKSDCTYEVVTMARKLLPKAALMFPTEMKRARAEMDTYVLRWEESLGGLFQKAQLFPINDMD